MDDATTDEKPLARREKSFIVLLALLQGLLLYGAEYADDHDWWLLSELKGQVPWYTLVLTVPSLMQLSLQRLDDRRFWSNTALTVVAFGITAGWAAWSVTGASGNTAEAVLWPFGATIAVTAFIAAPYLQVRLATGRFEAPYDDLVERAWQNALTLKVVSVMVCIGWLLLMLWQELFQLIGIAFFKELFREDPFIYLVTGLLTGLGVLVARTQQRAMRVARQVLFAIFTGFLPVAAFIAVIFLLSLPFTGLAPLQLAASTAVTLSLLIAALVLLLNAVVQSGRTAPYPRPLRGLVDAAILTTHVFAGIALYAVIVRIDEHGWTTDRFWALIGVLMLGAYALGYAWAVLRPGRIWMSQLPRVNVAISLALIAVGLLANSPVLDPHRIAVASQMAHIEAAADHAVVDDATLDRIEYLRFESGNRGMAALASLENREGASAEFTRTLAEVRARKARYSWQVGEPKDDKETAANLAMRIQRPEGDPPLPDALLAYMAKDITRHSGACPMDRASCFSQWVDVNVDGRNDVLICIAETTWVSCTVFGSTDGKWRALGRVEQIYPSAAELDAVRRGTIRVVPPRFHDLQFGEGASRSIQY